MFIKKIKFVFLAILFVLPTFAKAGQMIDALWDTDASIKLETDDFSQAETLVITFSEDHGDAFDNFVQQINRVVPPDKMAMVKCDEHKLSCRIENGVKEFFPGDFDGRDPYKWKLDEMLLSATSGKVIRARCNSQDSDDDKSWSV